LIGDQFVLASVACRPALVKSPLLPELVLRSAF
jgi:hypothetical protein